eukprot:540543-Pelagomonas_calceolata.AAC.1
MKACCISPCPPQAAQTSGCRRWGGELGHGPHRWHAVQQQSALQSSQVVCLLSQAQQRQGGLNKQGQNSSPHNAGDWRLAQSICTSTSREPARAFGILYMALHPPGNAERVSAGAGNARVFLPEWIQNLAH